MLHKKLCRSPASQVLRLSPPKIDAGNWLSPSRNSVRLAPVTPTERAIIPPVPGCHHLVISIISIYFELEEDSDRQPLCAHTRERVAVHCFFPFQSSRNKDGVAWGWMISN